jgi:hypothetical protein
MKYLSIYTPAATNQPMDPVHRAKMAALVRELMANGSLLMTAPLLSATNSGMRVSHVNGRETVTVAPLPDAKFAGAAGFALLQANSHHEIMELAHRFLAVAGDGETEIVPLLDVPGS